MLGGSVSGKFNRIKLQAFNCKETLYKTF